jgi:hypothetical protein
MERKEFSRIPPSRWGAEEVEAFIRLLRGEDPPEEESARPALAAGRCPECGGPLLPAGGCRVCPACGWEACGW